MADEPLIPGGPLPEGYRFRIGSTDSRAEDMDVYVKNGRLHLVGHYGRLDFRAEAPNHISIRVRVP